MANTTDYTRLLDGYALLAIKAYIANNYLLLSGGTLTGNLIFKKNGNTIPNISFQGTKATYAMIKFLDNTDDTYGNGISIGGGGAVVIGAGESANTIVSGAGVSGGTETLYLGSDGNIYLLTNAQNGYASAKTFIFADSGNLTVPGSITEAGVALSSKYLALSGGTMTGMLTVKSPILGYEYNVSNNNAAFILDKPGSNYSGIGSHAETDTIYFGACGFTGAWVDTYKQKWKFNGTIIEDGTALADKYLGKTAKAADSSKLDGHALSYFITTDNIASQSVYHASNSAALGGNGPAYYLNYNNFTNTPSVVLYTSQTLTDAQKTQARSNIGAGTSSFTGYTSSNKLHTDYINNAAGWTSVTESTVTNWGFTKNAGTVTSVKVGSTSYSPSSGVVSLPAYPTKSSWNYDDVYVKLTGNQSIAGTKTFTGKIEISDGQNSYIFTPGQGGDVVLELLDEQSNKTTVYLVNPNTPSTAQYIALRSWVNDQGFLKTAVTKLGSRTGDITIANLKTDLGLGSAAYTNSTAYATSGHTHTLSIASGGTASINLTANTTYTLTAGGKTYAFKTPPAGGSGYYSNQYNATYYLTSNSGAGFFAEDIQAGVSIVGINGGNAITLGIGWPGLEADSSKKSLLFNGNRVDLILTDNYQYYIKGLSIDMYDDDYYTIHIRANDYSDVIGSVSSENGAAVKLHASSFEYEPSYINSAVTYKKYVTLGVVMHNINYTYSSTVLLKMNIRGDSASEAAVTSYANLCGLLYYAGHRSAATCLTCSGRYSSYSNIVLGVYATAYNSGLYLVYCSASSNTVNTTAIASGTVTDTLSVSLVP